MTTLESWRPTLSRVERTLDRYAPPARAGGLLACLLFVAALFLGLVPLSVDAHAYWAADPLNPYNFGGLYTQDAYFYSPAFTQALGPLHALPWPLFAGLWTLLLTGVLAVLGGRWFGYVVIIPFVAIELAMGNIHILMAGAIVAGFRWPVAWSLILLTKITPGVGLLWFLVRREWRNLALAVGATAAVAGVSYAVAPSLWSEWLAVLRTTQAGEVRASTPFDFIPLPVRVVIAAGLVVWAARTDRAWLVPIAATLALPVVYLNGLAMLVAAPYLYTHQRREKRRAAQPEARRTTAMPSTPGVAG